MLDPLARSHLLILITRGYRIDGKHQENNYPIIPLILRSDYFSRLQLSREAGIYLLHMN